jgi:hypothetical protein
LKAAVDNSSSYDNGSFQLSVTANFTAGQIFYFNFTKGRYWGLEYDAMHGLEPANPEFAPNTAIPGYKQVQFTVSTPSGETFLTEVYLVAGVTPFAVVYRSQSADFVPLPGGNLTFGEVGIEGGIQRTGSYTVTVDNIVPYVLKSPTEMYNISGDPSTGDPPQQMSLYVEVPVEYSVTFSESGLPSDAQWWVSLNGNNESSFSDTINFFEPAGIYSYFAGASSYNASLSEGSISVNDTGITVPEVFSSLPEFPTMILLPLFLLALVFTTAIVRKKRFTLS